MNCLSHKRDMKRGTDSEMSAIAGSWPTRRSFLATLAAAGVAFGALSTFGAIAVTSGVAPRKSVPAQGAPPENLNDARRYGAGVVSFHMDQPYLDTTGTAAPYHPPRGARSAAPASRLAENAFRSTHCYV